MADAAPQIDWLAELKAAVANNRRGKAGVAQILGVSRGYVSQVMNGYYLTVPPEFVVRVVERLMVSQCPALGRAIPHSSCREYAARKWEAISQFEVDHWRQCQTCTCRAPVPMSTPLKPRPEEWVFIPRPRPVRRITPSPQPQGATA